jgi:hypothetical protein
MPLGRRSRDTYDPMDRTFYYFRPRSDRSGGLFPSLGQKTYFSVRFWIEI